MMKAKFTFPLLFLLLMLAGSTPPRPAHAATIAVTTTDDEVNDDGDCSLREAIIAANSDTATDACPAGSGADVVELPAGTYTLTRGGINNDDGLLGDLDISAELSIVGAGRADTVIDANGVDRALHILPSAGSVEISFLTVRGGSAIVPGAVYVFDSALQLTNTRLRANAGNGALYVTGGGSVTVANTRIFDNSGGGLFVGVNSSAVVRNSLISGNTDDFGAGISNSGHVTVLNSTLSGNSANIDGGGLRNDDATASVVFANATVTDNTADADGNNIGNGGGLAITQGTATAWNSIIAANVDGSGSTQHADCSGDLASEGYNLVQSTTGCTISGDVTGNITGVAPQLGSLQNNGGPTLTHALLAGSPAVDAGNPGGCEDVQGNLLATDQRGFVRPVDGGSGSARCDIGAFELASGGPFPATLMINATGDQSDDNPGDARCDVLPGVQGDQCSLRAAFEEANALGPNPDPASAPLRLAFNVAGAGPHTFTPGSTLPQLSVPVHIDGISQPGAACATATAPANLLIIVDGTDAGIVTPGIVLAAGSDGSAISGLVIGNFDNDGIQLHSDHNQVTCSYLGLGVDGVSGMGNRLHGLYVTGNHNTIGGVDGPWQRNVMADNDRGVKVIGDDNALYNNYVGVDAAGANALPNRFVGIYIEGHRNIVGGSAENSGNLISGNATGVRIEKGTDNLVAGNDIGVAGDGLTPLPNTGDGVYLYREATGNQIGGVAPGEGNVIAYNGQSGISVEANFLGETPSGNPLRGNSLYANAALAIDLGDDGPDVNDDGDADEGENFRQNYPVLQAIAGSPAVSGELHSQPQTVYLVDFYRSAGCDPSGHGEGEAYLGAQTVTTDGGGQVQFEQAFAASAVQPGDTITATATDPDGNSSEFSACTQLIYDPSVTPTPTATTPPPPVNTELYLPYFSR